VNAFLTAFPDLRYNVTHVIEDGDLFAVHMRCTGTNTGPFGPIEMGGMFTVMKVRDNLGRNDYRDPGWYRHPKGAVAREVPGGR
jgi:hypothetical protein